MLNNVLEFKREPPKEAANTKLIFYNTKDVAEMLGCSVPTARETMRKKDFPLIVVGKNWKVSKTAFEKWADERHD